MGLSAFMSVITLYTVYVYTLSYNKVIINQLLTAHGVAKALQNYDWCAKDLEISLKKNEYMSIGFDLISLCSLSPTSYKTRQF